MLIPQVSECNRIRALRFLIVDDNDNFRLILHQMVESQAHWSVLAEARDGCEAVRMAKVFSPDVILMDVVMPAMNGIEATSQIRRLGLDPYIILFSAYHEEEFRLSGLQAGAACLIWKEEITEGGLKKIVVSHFSSESLAQ